ncbi:alkaline phosphatase [Geosporobacter ferrireducens]|uniref:Alkaline phosphatase n=1 Tax=Geosporobacter ferrireducens TaxID=1424294 RepID=A0A1D8GQJ9_9FIRM|nr:alkaline phosphatase [Geosporobacter ferrireducens]AOT73186.1 alkaline phosphatase [Geosporobacter ferrireducens]MTI57971.1 alkaline phosphatase [Geosporobacter ferrireducens]
MKNRVLPILALLLVLTVALSAFLPSDTFAQAFSKTNNTYNGKTPKYVFLFIGDGTSFPQIAAAEMYLGAQKKTTAPQTKALDFTNFPATGVAATFDSDSFIPDSASTGTSIASGIKTGNGIINMDPQKQTSVEPITRKLKDKGYKIGVVSSVSIDHATPAVFYANEASRNNYYEIGLQLANSNFDYFGGGGFKDPEGKNTKMPNPQNILDVAKKNGFTVASTKDEILQLNNNSGKVIAINPELDADKAMPYEIDRKDGELKLSDYVRKGIEVLDNKNGFFMMVESGKIDWANHANDAAASIHDTIEFNNAVMEAYKVYEKYPNDTLIIVTGDHECGGLTIGFAGTEYETFFNKLEKQTLSYIGFDKIINDYKKSTKPENYKFEDLLPQIKTAFGLTASADGTSGLVLTASEYSRLQEAFKRSMEAKADRNYTDHEKIIYGTYEPLTVTLTHILNNKAGLSFTTYSHTGLPVPVYAVGLGHELFNGSYDNTDIYKKMAAITKADQK